MKGTRNEVVFVLLIYLCCFVLYCKTIQILMLKLTKQRWYLMRCNWIGGDYFITHWSIKWCEATGMTNTRQESSRQGNEVY